MREDVAHGSRYSSVVAYLIVRIRPSQLRKRTRIPYTKKSCLSCGLEPMTLTLSKKEDWWQQKDCLPALTEEGSKYNTRLKQLRGLG
jgi:hypothetical protein